MIAAKPPEPSGKVEEDVCIRGLLGLGRRAKGPGFEAVGFRDCGLNFQSSGSREHAARSRPLSGANILSVLLGFGCMRVRAW